MCYNSSLRHDGLCGLPGMFVFPIGFISNLFASDLGFWNQSRREAVNHCRKASVRKLLIMAHLFSFRFFPHKGVGMAVFVVACILEWGLDRVVWASLV